MDRVLSIMDEIADEEGAASKARMIRHYVITTRYEWMFWDSAYRQEAWPI